jgi:sugar/nucleoside kinase (ribokinase family)
MTATFDILGLGCVAIDDLLYVPSFPSADTKLQILRRERQCGGLTATAMVAAARLGSRCAYAGTLGEDELSQFVVDAFRHEGVDATHIRRRSGARPIHSIVIVDLSRQTRTILYDLEGVLGAQEDWPHADVIRAARILFVDHFGTEGMIRATKIAREASIPVVADFESDVMPRFGDLLALVDHLLISCEFGERLTGEKEPARIAAQLWTSERQAVVVTCGAAGCWFVDADRPDRPQHRPAFAVAVVDTTGCGDVFHGAYASGLARGLGLEERVRFASASAALKATRPGGQAGCPTLADVEAFLKAQDK